MFDDEIPDLRFEWITHMSADQWFATQKLEANCARTGLDVCLQAQINLSDARSGAEKHFWHRIWLHLQMREIGTGRDLFLTVIDTAAP